MLLSPSIRCWPLLPRYPASSRIPPFTCRCRVPFHCWMMGFCQSLKMLSPTPSPRLVEGPLTGLGLDPRGRLKPLGNGLLSEEANVRPPSLEMVSPVELWKPSVPELPDVPAACSTEPAYISPYAPRKSVVSLIR